jgi:hypothetical protein
MILKSLTPVTTHDANKRSSFKSHIGEGFGGAVPDPVIRYLDSKLCRRNNKSDLEPFLTPNPVVLRIGFISFLRTWNPKFKHVKSLLFQNQTKN